jgi:hypothetical protein
VATPAEPRSPAAPEAVPTPKRTRKPATYRIGRWAGRWKYSCRLCSYDTLVPENLQHHLRASHKRVVRVTPRKD